MFGRKKGELPKLSQEYLNKLLWDGVQNLDFNLCKFAITLGADVNASINDSPLISYTVGNIDIFKLFIKNGADIFVKDFDESNLLYDAVKVGNYEVIDFLLEAGLSAYKCDEIYGFTPLHFSVFNKDMETVRYCIEKKGWDINVRDDNNKTLLDVAVEVGEYNIAEFLIQKGILKNYSQEEKGDLLCTLFSHVDLGFLSLLLKNGVKPNIKNSKGFYPLFCCDSKSVAMGLFNEYEYPDLERVIVENASVLLELAFRKTNVFLLDLLQKKGVDGRVLSEEQILKLLHHTVISFNLRLLKLLFKYNVNIYVSHALDRNFLYFLFQAPKVNKANFQICKKFMDFIVKNINLRKFYLTPPLGPSSPPITYFLNSEKSFLGKSYCSNYIVRLYLLKWLKNNPDLLEKEPFDLT